MLARKKDVRFVSVYPRANRWKTYIKVILLTTVNCLNIRTPKTFVVITKIWTMWLYHRITSPNDADGMANSVDPDRSILIWVCTVCPGISVRKLRIITVISFEKLEIRRRNKIPCVNFLSVWILLIVIIGRCKNVILYKNGTKRWTLPSRLTEAGDIKMYVLGIFDTSEDMYISKALRTPTPVLGPNVATSDVLLLCTFVIFLQKRTSVIFL